MAPVKASPLDPATLLRDVAALADARGFRSEIFAEIEGFALPGLTRRAPGRRPRIYLSAGIHGDEPAPPLAITRLLETGVLDDRATWFIVPMLNPTGFLRGTRENAGGIDLNRDYKDRRSREVVGHVAWLERQPYFDLTLCLHEDWEAEGFYLYELNPNARPSLAETMLAAASVHGPIQPGEVIDGRAVAAPGIIRPAADPLERENWPEAIYLRAHHTTLSYTLETPSPATLELRVNMLAAAVERALAYIIPAV